VLCLTLTLLWVLSTAESVEREWFTRREVRAATGLALATIDQLISSGQLRSFKLGSKRIIPKSALRELEARKLAEAG
jgi:excisionase family DNA binding protein